MFASCPCAASKHGASAKEPGVALQLACVQWAQELQQPQNMALHQCAGDHPTAGTIAYHSTLLHSS